jgi:hypothetical protein
VFPRTSKKCPSKTCSLWVWVVDASTDQRLPGAKVTVIEGPAKPRGQMPKAGTCVFPNLPPGKYWVTASAQELTGYENSFLLEPQTVEVDIDPDGIGTATLKVDRPSYQVAIQLVDHEDHVVAAESYSFKAPNGASMKSKLTDTGFRRVNKIRPSGDCEIGFPDIDQDLWEFVKSTPGTDEPAGDGVKSARKAAVATSPHTVAAGDCISSIAFAAQLPIDMVWNAPQNKDLKNRRKDPCVLMPGDHVIIPPKRVKVDKRKTQFTHQYRVKPLPPREYKLQILLGDKPRQDVDYEVMIDGQPGVLKQAGPWISFLIPPDAKVARITLKFIRGRKLSKILLEKFEYTVQLGHLRPAAADTPGGIEDRLRNLGYYACWEEGVTPSLEKVLRLFQLSHGITPADGKVSSETLRKLMDLTGDPTS